MSHGRVGPSRRPPSPSSGDHDGACVPIPEPGARPDRLSHPPPRGHRRPAGLPPDRPPRPASPGWPSASTPRPSPSGPSAARSSTATDTRWPSTPRSSPSTRCPAKIADRAAVAGVAGPAPRRAAAGHRAAPGQRPPVRLGQGEGAAGRGRGHPRRSGCRGSAPFPRRSGSIRTASSRPTFSGSSGGTTGASRASSWPTTSPWPARRGWRSSSGTPSAAR